MRMLFFLLLLTSLSYSNSLKHYSIQKLSKKALETSLQQRFKAKGKPLFLVHDINYGLSQGDFIRFNNKVILIDGAVYQTLQGLGVFKSLKSSPIIKIKAKAKSRVWKRRAQMDPKQKKSYLFAGEVLKVFEGYFKKLPNKEEIILQFDGPYMSFVLPKSVAKKLRYQKVKAIQTGGDVSLVSKAPLPIYQGQQLDWQPWAIDTRHPSTVLKYSIEGNLPNGITWNDSSHTLEGTSDSIGVYPLHAIAKNPIGDTDTLHFSLSISENKPPEINLPAVIEVIEGTQWKSKVLLRDPEEGYESLQWKHFSNTIEVNISQNSLLWDIPKGWGEAPASLEIEAKDSFGNISKKEIRFTVLRAEDLIHKKGFQFEVPWDTLITAHSYKYQFSSKLNSYIKRVEINDDVLSLKRSKGLATLSWTPEVAGSHKLRAIFDYNGNEVSFEQELVVIQNSAPQILTKLSSEYGITGQNFSYTPIAIDVDQDSISWKISSTSFQWDGKNLTAISDSAKEYVAQIVASDKYGASSSQWIRWEVEKEEKELKAWSLSNKRFYSNSHWDLSYQSGAVRGGLFSTDLPKSFPPTAIYQQMYPYAYIGGSFLGSKRASKGENAFLDLGLTFRALSKSIFGGGVMLRFDGDWTFGKWKSKLDMLLYARQIMLLVTDTKGSLIEVQQKVTQNCDESEPASDYDKCRYDQLKKSAVVVEKCGELPEINFDNVQSTESAKMSEEAIRKFQSQECQELLYTYGLDEGINNVWKDFADDENVLSMIEFETVYPVHKYLDLGFSFWRQDIILRKHSELMLSLVADAHKTWYNNYFGLRLKLGYGTISTTEDAVLYEGKLTSVANLPSSLTVDEKSAFPIGDKRSDLNDWRALLEFTWRFQLSN